MRISKKDKLKKDKLKKDYKKPLDPKKKKEKGPETLWDTNEPYLPLPVTWVQETDPKNVIDDGTGSYEHGEKEDSVNQYIRPSNSRYLVTPGLFETFNTKGYKNLCYKLLKEADFAPSFFSNPPRGIGEPNFEVSHPLHITYPETRHFPYISHIQMQLPISFDDLDRVVKKTKEEVEKEKEKKKELGK